MNRVHHWLCGSAHWRQELKAKVIPWVLDGVNLGSNVLEVGPGPGLTTDILRTQITKLTALELDPGLANSLAARMRGTNVTAVQGDATAMPFPDAQFSGAVCFTMLHHVPTSTLQDKLLREVLRVLQPGGVLAGVDGLTSTYMRIIHIFDTLVPIDPTTFQARLQTAGFEDVLVEASTNRFRFRARKPARQLGG